MSRQIQMQIPPMYIWVKQTFAFFIQTRKLATQKAFEKKWIIISTFEYEKLFTGKDRETLG